MLIKEICIQNDDRDLLVSTKAGFRNRINFYNTAIKSKGKTSEELIKLSENSKGFYSQGIVTYNNETEVLPYSIPAPLLRNRTGSVTTYVDVELLFSPMYNLLAESNGKMTVVDKCKI